MVAALVSAFTGRPVNAGLAMTGAIALEGQVLPVAGVHDKVLAAHRCGLDRVLQPRRNAKEVHEELGDDLRRAIADEYVSHLDELLKRGCGAKPRRPAPCPSPSRTPARPEPSGRRALDTDATRRSCPRDRIRPASVNVHHLHCADHSQAYGVRQPRPSAGPGTDGAHDVPRSFYVQTVARRRRSAVPRHCGRSECRLDPTESSGGIERRRPAYTSKCVAPTSSITTR